MQRHLENHPSLDNSSGNFSSNSQPLSTTSAPFDRMPVSQGTSNQGLRPPFANIQETVHPVEESRNSEMESRMQFSLPGGVINATTRSEEDLAQLVQIVERNPQAFVEEFETCNIGDALAYLYRVKHEQPHRYYFFVDVLKKFQSQRLNRFDVVQIVSILFHDFPNLIEGFSAFLPPGYKIEVQSDNTVLVSTPDCNNSTSQTMHLTSSPATLPLQPEVNQTAAHFTLSGATTPTRPVANNQPPSNDQSYSEISSSLSSEGSTSTAHSPPTNSLAFPRLAIFDQATSFVNKVKNRFRGQPEVYLQFLEIFHNYQKEQRNIANGVHLAAEPLTQDEVCAQVAKLFQNHEDLLREFGCFLPDDENDENAQPVDLESTSVTGIESPMRRW